MATIVELETGRIGYAELVNLVRQRGQARSPHGLKTYDLGHVDIILQSPYDALPLGVGRSLNSAIAAGEAVQLIAGRARHDLLPRISPTFNRFVEPDGYFHGAYGDRIGNQVGEQIVKLKNDSDTRQAVITLWNPELDNVPDRRDYPCTVALNFAIINDRLELRTLMRSNDVWLGWPHDVFQFTQLQLTVARAIDIEPGQYTHTTWSLHLYDEHTHLVDRLHEGTRDVPSLYQPDGFGKSGNDWSQCRARALLTLFSERLIDPTESEEWYSDRL